MANKAIEDRGPIMSQGRSFKDLPRDEVGTIKKAKESSLELGKVLEIYKILVSTTAFKYTKPGTPKEDLEQAGYIGLMRAIDSWDHTKGMKFTTWAIWYINVYIRKDAQIESEQQKHTISLDCLDELLFKDHVDPRMTETAPKVNFDQLIPDKNHRNLVKKRYGL